MVPKILLIIYRGTLEKQAMTYLIVMIMSPMRSLFDVPFLDYQAVAVPQILTCQLDHLILIFAAPVVDSELEDCYMLPRPLAFWPRILPKRSKCKG